MTGAMTVTIAAALAGAGGLLVPWMIRDLPPHQEDAISYREVSETRWLAGWAVVLCAAAGAALGAALGWSWALLPPLLVVAPCVALALIDARTHLLPTRIIAPMGLAVAAAVLVTAVAAGDLEVLVRGAGGLVAGTVVFWALWRFTSGMGFGDVRLAGVLGLMLAAHSWSTLAIGLYAAFILAALTIPLRRLAKASNPVPFGPFLILGAWVALMIAT